MFMRKLLLSFALLSGAFVAQAQTTATFEALTLSKADTFYSDYSKPGEDVGFYNGLAYFPCVFDTSSFGPFWSYGFAYSNMTDTVTSGFGNQYAAKTGAGYAGSSQYVVAYGVSNTMKLTGAAVGKSVLGFFITNSTYAYNSMRDGDAFAKKFGGTSGTDPDWFKLVVKGYSGGVLKADSVEHYLADFRSSTSSGDYIVKGWQWVDLIKLGHVDSLLFTLSSSDVGAFGMNTPSYFCMDNFITNETSVSISETDAIIARAYPNPATDRFFVDLKRREQYTVAITDCFGKVVAVKDINDEHIELDISALPSGVYMVNIQSSGTQAVLRFVKRS